MSEKKILFISDLHLSNERPEKLTLFKALLEGPARSADALYILGDLFEAWAGDDDLTSPHPEIIAMLSSYTDTGAKFYLMRGNRDFLLGEKFARDTGAELLNDTTLIELNGKTTLLMHGDTLCSRDVMYQIYRRIVNNPFSIKLFMTLPYSFRVKIWHGVRNLIRNAKKNKSPYIVDVYQPTVEKIMVQYNVTDLIHGQTHKQAIHEFKLNHKPARRLVLGDWYDKDCVLVADANGLKMMGVQELLNVS
jgi:UDP-2,3-diacylglucosamine hydrolase